MQAEEPAVAGYIARWRPVLVENSATSAGLGFHAAGRYSLISPASLVLRWIRVAGTGKAMTSGSSSGARRFIPSPWWLRPVLCVRDKLTSEIVEGAMKCQG